jgi:prevent-host-death family protein
MMEVSVSDAKGLLTELVRRAEAGEDVVITRHGQAVARLVRAGGRVTPEERRALFDELRAMPLPRDATEGPCAARSQDFLYDEDGLPR